MIALKCLNLIVWNGEEKSCVYSLQTNALQLSCKPFPPWALQNLQDPFKQENPENYEKRRKKCFNFHSENFEISNQTLT